MRRLKLALRLLIFLAISVVEVRVKAAESVRLPQLSSSEITQLPQDCLRILSESCAVATFDRRKFLLEWGGAKIWLDQNTSVVRVTPAEAQVKEQLEVRLIKGTLWIQTSKPVRVSGEFGSFFFNGAGAAEASKTADSSSENPRADFWVRHEKDRMVGSSVHQALQMRARGAREILTVPEGLENWIGRVGIDGQGTSGVPMPIGFADHVGRWARLFPGKKKDFEQEVEKFHEAWVEAAQLSADINQNQFERKIASIPIALDPKSVVKKAPPVDPRKKFNDAINALFRRKVFSGE